MGVIQILRGLEADLRRMAQDADHPEHRPNPYTIANLADRAGALAEAIEIAITDEQMAGKVLTDV